MRMPELRALTRDRGLRIILGREKLSWLVLIENLLFYHSYSIDAPVVSILRIFTMELSRTGRTLR